MPLIKITATNTDDLFKTEFPVLPAGKHLFEIANVVEPISPTDPAALYAAMLKFEFRCQDENESKGMPIFENILIYTNAVDSKTETAKRIHDARLAQLLVACGMLSMDDVKAGKDFDTAAFQGKRFDAVSKVVNENVYPEELDATGKPKKAPRAHIAKFLFEPSK